MVDVFYYYYYLFYTKVFSQKDPSFTTLLALSLVESLLINAVLEQVLVRVYCTTLGKWIMLSVLLVLLIINYLHYNKYGRGIKILKKKPKFFNDNFASVIIVTTLSILIISWLFWGAVSVRDIMKQCT